jgi:hypothetical protein
VKNWPLVEEAIEAKIDDQVEFVRWWDERVRPAGRRAIIADREIISADDAEASTGVTPKQVSRWRKKLKDPKKYREAMIIAAFRKAELVPETGGRGADGSTHHRESEGVQASDTLLAAATLPEPGHFNGQPS